MSGGVNERVQEFIIIQLCTCLSRVCHVDMYSTVSLCTGQVQMREKQLASMTFLPSPHEACLLVRSDEMCLPHEACLLAQGDEMCLLCGREGVFASAA